MGTMHAGIKKIIMICSKKENKLFFLTLLVSASLLSGFIPVSETALSQSIRQHLISTSQPLFKTNLQKNQIQREYMVKELGIDEKKVVTLPKQQQTPKDTPAEQWGKATQIDEHTWTMKITADSTMASARDILDALNNYRQKKGKGTLSWDDKLAAYAEQRAQFFSTTHKLDGHAGFQAYVTDDGFTKLGFGSLGENSSYGYKLVGVHIIEWIYAGDAPHDSNQLSSEWTHVGIGVSETSTDLIFGGQKR